MRPLVELRSSDIKQLVNENYWIQLAKLEKLLTAKKELVSNLCFSYDTDKKQLDVYHFKRQFIDHYDLTKIVFPFSFMSYKVSFCFRTNEEFLKLNQAQLKQIVSEQGLEDYYYKFDVELQKLMEAHLKINQVTNVNIAIRQFNQGLSGRAKLIIKVNEKRFEIMINDQNEWIKVVSQIVNNKEQQKVRLKSLNH